MTFHLLLLVFASHLGWLGFACFVLAGLVP
jgi:hypothetical protein